MGCEAEALEPAWHDHGPCLGEPFLEGVALEPPGELDPVGHIGRNQILDHPLPHGAVGGCAPSVLTDEDQAKVLPIPEQRDGSDHQIVASFHLAETTKPCDKG